MYTTSQYIESAYFVSENKSPVESWHLHYAGNYKVFENI